MAVEVTHWVCSGTGRGGPAWRAARRPARNGTGERSRNYTQRVAQ